MTQPQIADRPHSRIERSLRVDALLLIPILLLWAQPARAVGEFSAGATFTRITSGDLVTTPAWYWSPAWGDYDDDGYLDLFIGASYPSPTNFLYHNERDGTFALVDAAHMPKSPSNQHGAAWGDYDNDGHLDLIVTAGNPQLTHNMLYRNNGDGTLSWDTDNPIYSETFANGFHAPSWGDYDNDGLLDLFIAGHDTRNRLFHNEGDGSFTRITDHVLVNDPANSEGRAWTDYDDDGDLDLFVSNISVVGLGFRSVLYRNDGGGVFTRVTDSGLSNRRTGDTFASCWADYDNDGLQDLFLANAVRNSLYHNAGGGKFTQITNSAVVQDPIPSGRIFSGCAWGDYDNDGFIDLFVTTGDFDPVPPRAHNFLYHNEGDGGFTKVTEGSVVNDVTTACPGASWGDYDNDGFLDLIVAQGAFQPFPQTALLYRNDGNANAWLNVKLVGTVSNRSGIGAKVRVKAFYRGASRWQLREISGGDSENNQQSLNAEFGLADATTIDTLRVEWPSGIVEERHGVAPRQFLTIPERLEQQLFFDPLPDRSFGDPPFTVSATASSGLPVSFRASGSCAVEGDQVSLTGVGLCTLTALQEGDDRYQPAPEVSQAFSVFFAFGGFLPPVADPPALNRMNPGRVVPVKFELAGEPGPDVLDGGRPLVRPVDCETLAPEAGYEAAASPGASALRYQEPRGRYVFLWQTQKSWVGSCRELALPLVDGSVHRVYFSFKSPSLSAARRGGR